MFDREEVERIAEMLKAEPQDVHDFIELLEPEILHDPIVNRAFMEYEAGRATMKGALVAAVSMMARRHKNHVEYAAKRELHRACPGSLKSVIDSTKNPHSPDQES